MTINEIRRQNMRALAKQYDGGELVKVAARLGKSPGQISHLIGASPTKNIGNKIAREVEDAYGKPLGWLDREHSPTAPAADDDNLHRPQEAGPTQLLSASSGAEPRSDDDVLQVPVLNVAGSMGSGLLAPEHETIVDFMRLSMSGFVRRHLTISRPSALRVVIGYGDSMLPTFADGDPLLVDTGVNEIKLDAVYVLGRGDELFIKRVQRRLDGGVIIKSDNPLYESYVVPPSEVGELRVLARVVWAWNGKKL